MAAASVHDGHNGAGGMSSSDSNYDRQLDSYFNDTLTPSRMATRMPSKGWAPLSASPVDRKFTAHYVSATSHGCDQIAFPFEVRTNTAAVRRERKDR